MHILNYIDNKFTIHDQESYLYNFWFFGMPVGISVTQLLLIFIEGWSKYHISYPSIIATIIIDVLLTLPFYINKRKYDKKYKLIIEKIKENKVKVKKVKAKFNYEGFIKGKSYDFDDYILKFNSDKIFVYDEDKCSYYLSHIMNKFELQDLKEERVRKLNKLKKIK